jgi:DNA repair photolyase
METIKGRVSCSNEKYPFGQWPHEVARREASEGIENPRVKTVVMMKTVRSIISRKQYLGMPVDASINTIQGCENGCVYCVARPTHEYLGLSAGQDFETKLFAKSNAVELLRSTFEKRNYTPEIITLGSSTDVYQPAEKKLRLARGLLEVFEEFQHPVSISTKSSLVLRDLDILTRLAKKGLARVDISITSLDSKLSRTLEPKAGSPSHRLTAIEQLSAAGVPVGVTVAPVIPAITDHQIEAILQAAATSGATSASYVLLRLPHEVEGRFKQWLELHFPSKAKRALSLTLLSNMWSEALSDPRLGAIIKGNGAYAKSVRERFEVACAEYGLAQFGVPVKTDLFRVPQSFTSSQLRLF